MSQLNDDSDCELQLVTSAKAVPAKQSTLSKLFQKQCVGQPLTSHIGVSAKVGRQAVERSLQARRLREELGALEKEELVEKRCRVLEAKFKGEVVDPEDLKGCLRVSAGACTPKVVQRQGSRRASLQD